MKDNDFFSQYVRPPEVRVVEPIRPPEEEERGIRFVGISDTFKGSGNLIVKAIGYLYAIIFWGMIFAVALAWTWEVFTQ